MQRARRVRIVKTRAPLAIGANSEGERRDTSLQCAMALQCIHLCVHVCAAYVPAYIAGVGRLIMMIAPARLYIQVSARTTESFL